LGQGELTSSGSKGVTGVWKARTGGDRRIGCIVFQRIASRLDESIVQGVPGSESATHLSGSRSLSTHTDYFLRAVLWSTNWMILLAICQVVVICPTVGHLLLSVVIGQLRTPAQVVSSVIGDCSNLVVLTFETELSFVLRLFCFSTFILSSTV